MTNATRFKGLSCRTIIIGRHQTSLKKAFKIELLQSSKKLKELQLSFFIIKKGVGALQNFLSHTVTILPCLVTYSKSLVF